MSLRLRRPGGSKSSAVRKKGKAIIILNPAKPSIIMRNTLYLAYKDGDSDQIQHSIDLIVREVQQYVPGYALRGKPIFDKRDTPQGKKGYCYFTAGSRRCRRLSPSVCRQS